MAGGRGRSMNIAEIKAALRRAGFGGDVIVTAPTVHPPVVTVREADGTPSGPVETIEFVQDGDNGLVVSISGSVATIGVDPIYLLLSGVRPMEGDLDLGNFDIVDLRDIQPMRNVVQMNDLQEMRDLVLARDFEFLRDILSMRSTRFDPARDLTGLSIAEGVAWWNQERKTLQLESEIEGLGFPTNQSLVVRGYADSGNTIEAGKVVLIVTGDDGRATFGKANAAFPDVHLVVGVTPREMTSGGDGYAVVFGICEGFDTSAWAAGAQLYLTGAGDLTDVEPEEGCGPYVRIGKVLRSDATTGAIFVDPGAMPRLNDLSDVKLSTDSPAFPTVVDPVLGPTSGDEFKVLTLRDGGECPAQWQDEWVSHPNIVDRSEPEAHPAAAITFDPASSPTPLSSTNAQDAIDELDLIKEPRGYAKHFMFLGAH